MRAVYDTIRTGYIAQRRADPRITQAILGALGDAASVVNVDPRSGRWETRFGRPREQDSIDLGYRLVVADRGARDRRPL